MKQKCFNLVIVMVILFCSNYLFSEKICWVHWDKGTIGASGKAYGTITLTNGKTINVTYDGDIYFIQTNNTGTNYWNPSTPYYDNKYVSNPPDTKDIITIGDKTAKNKITFSSDVSNPIMAIVSLGQYYTPVRYEFDQDFEVLKYGKGYWGNGTLKKEDNTLIGKEGHGIIRFQGNISEISWSVLDAEVWQGFTIGVPCEQSGSSDSNTNDCSDKYNEGFEAGKKFCKEYPTECGIDIQEGYTEADLQKKFEEGKKYCQENPSACGIYTKCPDECNDNQSSDINNNANNCSTFDFLTNTLHIPCFNAGTKTYWFDFTLTNDNPVTLQLKKYGSN